MSDGIKIVVALAVIAALVIVAILISIVGLAITGNHHGAAHVRLLAGSLIDLVGQLARKV